jgi:hypothetical protein
MTTPHPTPEERYEAAAAHSHELYWNDEASIPEAKRIAFTKAIREAEAAGEARGRAMERAERERSIPWAEASPIDQERYRYVAAAILAMQAERRGVKP